MSQLEFFILPTKYKPSLFYIKLSKLSDKTHCKYDSNLLKIKFSKKLIRKTFAYDLIQHVMGVHPLQPWNKKKSSAVIILGQCTGTWAIIAAHMMTPDHQMNLVGLYSWFSVRLLLLRLRVAYEAYGIVTIYPRSRYWDNDSDLVSGNCHNLGPTQKYWAQNHVNSCLQPKN